MRKRFVAIVATVAVSLTVSPAHAAVHTGGAGSDEIFGTAKADRLDGAGGSDLIFAKGNPKVRKGKRKKVDVVQGGAGEDVLLGGGGPDLLLGGDDLGSDLMHDSDGTPGDVMRAGPGADILFAADGKPTVVDCGPGTDAAIADVSDTTKGCELVISGSYPAFAFPGGGPTFNVIFGTSEADQLNGTAGADIVLGLPGDDQILLTNSTASDIADGGSGADLIVGSDLPDRLIDDDGTPGDQLFGGDGGDVILAADGAIDTIDCGESDGEVDNVFADPDDNIQNCIGDNVIVGHDEVL